MRTLTLATAKAAPTSRSPYDRKRGGLRTNKPHQWDGGNRCTECGIRNDWVGARGPCPPVVAV
jgi:hypothetical protein